VELFHTNGSLVFGGSARICLLPFLKAPPTVSGKPICCLGSRKFCPASISSGANSPKSSWEATSFGRRDDAKTGTGLHFTRCSWFGWSDRGAIPGWTVAVPRWGVHSFLNGVHGFFVIGEHDVDYGRDGECNQYLSWRDFVHLNLHHLYILSTIFFILNPGSCIGLDMFLPSRLLLLLLGFFLHEFLIEQYSKMDQTLSSRTKVQKIPRELYMTYRL
jgi:hypothetical protein